MRKFRIFPRPSTIAFIREASKSPSFSLMDWIHGYVYGRWTYLYIGIGKGNHPLAKIIRPMVGFFQRISYFLPTLTTGNKKTTFSDTYHGKVISVNEAKKLVTVNREIVIDDLEKVIPYTKARSIILKNPENIVVLDCPCRLSSPTPCLPVDVCLIIGEPFASFVVEHHPHRSRKITQAEALTIVEQEHKRGHVQHAFFKEAMLNRFYAICNCCGCCCGAIQAMKNGTPMLASSGYIANIDAELCEGCLACVHFCQFQAIAGERHQSVTVDTAQCLGCGVCADKCKNGAITLTRAPEKGVPLVVEKLLNSENSE
ncbi:4Fe-4S binding protein [Desulfogranum marinum]|uniref:4Fe-4S binding protein n=1 Tax=Desulfogranum marinum TaxID=453220 RepID=UPI0029C6DA7C|nr:4Fe-4S binding protein [Desulfogranum marinum]